jgi:surfeit locus 1 family protein
VTQAARRPGETVKNRAVKNRAVKNRAVKNRAGQTQAGLAGGWLAGALIALAAGFVALGVWQVERRDWKHALIAAVGSRARAPAVPAPGPATWRAITPERDGYRHLRVTGRYLPGRETLVRAVSERGAGYWVLAPLDTGRFTVLINRGFIAPDQRQTPRREPGGTVTVTGLLRVTEPGGGFLRRNDPAAGAWYSRDVAAIARARGIVHAAPYFIDADARPATPIAPTIATARTPPGAPIGGLTVIRFADNHAAYALTWFAMALLSAGGAWRVARRPRGRAPA